MMARKCVCKICNKQLTTDIAYKIEWKGKNTYFCNKDEADKWVSKMTKELEELPKWDELYKFVKFEIMRYREEQNLPRYLVQRLKDLRDGVVFQMNVGRIQKVKEGYPFEVIIDTFKGEKDTILYWFNNKSFQNERQQINYMMAIIESNINNYFADWVIKKRKEVQEKRVKIMEDIYTINDIKPTVTNKQRDLSEFLD